MYDELGNISTILESLAISRLLVKAKTGQDMRDYDLHIATVGLRLMDGRDATTDNVHDKEAAFLAPIYEARIWGTNLVGDPSEHLDVALSNLASKLDRALTNIYGF